MANSNYYDFGFMAEKPQQEADFRMRFYNQSHASFIFLFCCASLLSINLTNVYSAGFGMAEILGKEHWYYLLRQSFFLGIGIVACILTVKLPTQAIKYLSPVLILASLIVLSLRVVFKLDLVDSQVLVHGVFLSSILYWSAFFSNRDNCIETIREMAVPACFTIAILFLILINYGFLYVFAYMVITIVMFALCGVNAGSVFLTILFSLIPSSLYLLTSPEKVKSLLKFLVPGLYSSELSSVSEIAKSAISSGLILGKGLGDGNFKFLIPEEIISDYSFCNLAEELGFVGVCIFFLILTIYVVCGVRSSRYNQQHNLFVSDTAVGIVVLTVFQAIWNLTLILGILPFSGISFPFLSSGPEIIVYCLEIGILFRSFNTERKDEESIS